MVLQKELGLKHPIVEPAHEAVLNIYYTASCVKKRAAGFFCKFSLTDVQFNLMMLLAHQDQAGKGLAQVQLSQMMLVTRANISSLIDRMEKAGLVKRSEVVSDRRYNLIKLTAHGRKLLNESEHAYMKQVRQIMCALKPAETKKLIRLLEKTRQNLLTQTKGPKDQENSSRCLQGDIRR